MKKESIQTIELNKEDTEDKLTNILCRQTNLTKEQALELLKKHNYSLKLALFDHNNIIKKTTSVSSINQERYKLIRQTLDGKFNNYAN
jgi:N-acetylmuramic acid 6-phosphate (MurNAc-6-P) etherase